MCLQFKVQWDDEESPNGNRISKLITAVYKVNRQDKTRDDEADPTSGFKHMDLTPKTYPDYRSDDNKESMMKAYKALNKLTQTYTMNDQMRGPMIMHPTACCVSSRQP